MSNLVLLTELLGRLPWPAGTNSKLVTLAQCRCPTAQLLARVDSVNERGEKIGPSSSGSFSAGSFSSKQVPSHDEVLVVSDSKAPTDRASLAATVEDNERRSNTLLLWKQLGATIGDDNWQKYIDKVGQKVHVGWVWM